MSFTVERMTPPLTKTALKILKTHEGVNAPPTTFEEFLKRTGADLHKTQKEFLTSEARYTAYLAGFGSGKSFCLAIKVIKLCYQNQGKIGCLFGPTQSMIRDTIQTHLDEVLERSAIAFEYRASPLPEYKISLPDGTCTILLRGFENWNRIRGGNWAWAAIDEADTAKKEIVTQAMRMIDARLRKKVEGGGVRQTVMASTPEGVGSFLHTFFVRDPQKNPELAKRQHVIHGSTYENAHNLADGYIDDLLVRYPDDLIKAYLNGEWVNLNQKLVYPEFNRVLNGTKFIIDEDDDLYVGMDFNVGNCSAVTVVCGNGDDKFYALDEFTEVMDTPAMIDALIRAYPGHHEREKIWIVPDASAKNRDTSNASQSDLILLREAGFSVIEYNQNPRIKDRVAGLRANLKNAKGDRTLFVNGDRCPRSVECLEAQGYDEKTGLPDKTSGFDHVNDALGYVMAHLNPLGRLREKPATFRLY